MEQPTEQKGTGRELRLKIINLMYLIFIVLAFLYIPSNFIDVFKNLNSTFEKSAGEYDVSLSIGQLNNFYDFNTLIFNYLTQTRDEEYKKARSDLRAILNSAKSGVLMIDGLKSILINRTGGFNEFGYLKNSKNYGPTEFVLLRENMADSLLNFLVSFKSQIRIKVNEKCYRSIDNMIETNDYIKSSSGELKKWGSYYFTKMPVSGAVTILSKFQNDILKAVNTVIESYISDLTENKDSLIVNVNNFNFNKIRAFVSKDGIIDSLNIDSTGRIKFFPSEEGTFMFTIYDNFRKMEKIFIVKDLGPVVLNSDLPVLYTGIDNLISVKHQNFDYSRILVTTTLGEIDKSSRKFFLRSKSEGLAIVKAYGIDKSGKKLLATQKFIISELPDLKAFLVIKPNDSIAASELKSQKELFVSSDYTGDDDLYVKEFRVKRIHQQSLKNLIEVAENKGAEFSSTIKRVVEKAQAGDI